MRAWKDFRKKAQKFILTKGGHYSTKGRVQEYFDVGHVKKKIGTSFFQTRALSSLCT